jgi:hypothetical protein
MEHCGLSLLELHCQACLHQQEAELWSQKIKREKLKVINYSSLLRNYSSNKVVAFYTPTITF